MANLIIDFLTDLSGNNNKDWFDAHRKQYEEARNELLFITESLIKGINTFDHSIDFQDPKKCLFRQNRDIRFSKNKQPYKTTMSAFISKGGKNSPFSGYYIHFEPDNSFIGGGIYGPDASALKAIRSEIYFNYAEWENIVSNPEFVGKFNGLMTEGKLQRPPKGFPADFHGIDFLKYKHFVVSNSFHPEKIAKEKIVDLALDSFRIMHPFNEFLNNALANSTAS